MRFGLAPGSCPDSLRPVGSKGPEVGVGPGQALARHQGATLARHHRQGWGPGGGLPSLPFKATWPLETVWGAATLEQTRGQRRAGEALVVAVMGSVVPQVEEAHAGGGFLHRDSDEVGSDIGDKDMLNEAAGGLPVLAGLHRHRQVLLGAGR